MSRPLVIAHRGASGERPENTRAAFEQAIAERADMIELDLHLSRDRVVMIHHDAGLRRLGASGGVAEHTAAELARLDVALGSGPSEGMPTLQGVLEEFAGRIELNLEIKVGDDGPYPGIEEIALGAVEDRGLLPRMLFSSFSDRVLARLRALSPAARIGVLVSPRARRRPLERAAAVGAEALHPHVRLVDVRWVARAHAEGLAVYPYTEDDPKGMKRLLDCGVDGIITNHPARLRRLLEAREVDV